ncbi:unnamed protein product, partial [Staurois parvus]
MSPVSAHQCHINATYQCLLVHINATYQCLPVYINATYQCPSVLPFSANYQCQSVPTISAANQCHLSVPYLSVPPISAHQCSLSLPITAASLARLSEGEKSLIYKMF